MAETKNAAAPAADSTPPGPSEPEKASEGFAGCNCVASGTVCSQCLPVRYAGQSVHREGGYLIATGKASVPIVLAKFKS